MIFKVSEIKDGLTWMLGKAVQMSRPRWHDADRHG